MPTTPETITCIECSGTAHLASFEPDEGFQPGDVVAYVCEDCGHRHDVEMGDDHATDNESTG